MNSVEVNQEKLVKEKCNRCEEAYYIVEPKCGHCICQSCLLDSLDALEEPFTT